MLKNRTPWIDTSFDDWPTCLWLAGLVLTGLMIAKIFAAWPYIGPIAANLLNFWQLYLPMWRCERWQRPYQAVGLTWHAVKDDMRNMCVLTGLCLPCYALGAHAWLTHIWHWTWATPQAPQGFWGMGHMMWSFITLSLTHILAVALPEEVFYRGYLQSQLQKRWPASQNFAGAPMGKAALLANALFALGHFLGEWQLPRLATFFPGLLFAWLRNRQGSVIGSVGLHAIFNIFAELWFACYRR